MVPSARSLVPRRSPYVLLLASVFALWPYIGQAQRPSPNAERAFARAVQLYSQHMYTDAIGALEAYRRTYPNHVHAGESLYLEASAALAENQDERASRLFRQFERKYPSHPRASDAQLQLAQHFLDKGRVNEARTQLNTIARDPASRSQGARALYLLGRTEQKQGNLDAALQHFRRVTSTYPSSDVAPAALYATGATQVQREKYDRAASAFEELGTRFPQSGFAKNLGTALAEVYYRLGQYENAAAELENRLPELEGSGKARAHFLLAEAYNHLRRGEDAVVQYRRVMDDYPGSPYVGPAQYGLAWHYQRSGQYENAATAFARVRQNRDGRLAMRATYYEAVNLARTRRGDQAVSQYEGVITTYPNSPLAPEALFEAGLLRYQQQQYGSAAAFFRRLIRTYPSAERAGSAYFWLGNAYLAQDDLSRALEAYDQATKRNAAPDSVLVEARFQQAWAQYENNRYGDAASAFLAIVESAPRSTQGRASLFWAGDSFYQQDNFGRARSLFQRYLRENPNGSHAAGAQYALAWSHFKQNRFQEAAQGFRAFLDSYANQDTDIPYEQDARLRLGDCYFAMKRYEDAVTVYRRVGGQGADYALYQAGEALNYAGRRDEAVRSLNRLIEEYPQSSWRPEAQYRLATIHFQDQQYDEARSAYRQFLDTYPEHRLAPAAQYGIGDAHYNAGEMTEAVAAYRSVLEEHPQSSTANEAASSLFFALSAANQDDRAEEIISSIAQATPEANLTDRLQFSRAKAAFQSGESEKALRLFRSFVRTSSSESYLPESYYYLGLLYADQDSPTEATNYLQQLVKQYPESDVLPDGALRLGDIYLKDEAYQKALETYRTAAESEQINDELRAQALYGQGIALLKLERNDEAKRLLNEILQTERGGPLEASAKLGLARIYQDENRTDDALDLYRSVAEMADSETGAEALYRLGALLRERGDSRAAIQELERMSSLFGGYPGWIARSLLEQARAYRQMGQPGQADQMYDQVMTSYPGTPFAETAESERKAL